MTDEYIAGFFDGEGCIYLHHRSNRPAQAYLTFTQNTREVLDLIREHLGCGKVRSKSGGCYALIITGRVNILRVIRLMYPHSVVKREQLKLAHRLVKLVNPVGKNTTPEVKAERDRLADEIRKLRGKGKAGLTQV